MKKLIFLAPILSLYISGCVPHFHLDFLGKDIIEEVELVKSESRLKILVIDVDGFLGSSVNPGLLQREGDILSRVYYRLKKASEDKTIKGVILRLNTPGGEVTATDILYNEIKNFREKTGMPVVGLMGGLAASGGYYVASACDYIIAHPSTLTGSIGVILLFPNLQDLFSKIGIEVNVIKSGKMKDSGGFWKDVSEEEKKVFQGIIDEFHLKFLDVIYKNRKEYLSMEELEKIADGRLYTAHQAHNLKLIDEVGYFNQALKKTLSLASLKEAKVIAYSYYPKQKTNLYAAGLKSDHFLESKKIKSEDLFTSLKNGFYYMWLPQFSVIQKFRLH